MRVASPKLMPDFAEYYVDRKTLKSLEDSDITILSCGTGEPYVSTDTAAVIRALQLDVDAILKGTKVKGVYSKHPDEKGAKFLKQLTPQQMLRRGLKIVDAAAATLVIENKMPIIVFRIFEKGNLVKVLYGDESIGSRVIYNGK